MSFAMKLKYFFYTFLYSQLGILSRYPPELNITWTTVAKDHMTNVTFFKHITGDAILSLLKRNYSVKVFERLHTRRKREEMSKRMSLIHKMDIFKDYSYPKPFPADKFTNLPHGSPDQAYLILGTRGTGR